VYPTAEIIQSISMWLVTTSLAFIPLALEMYGHANVCVGMFLYLFY